MLDPMLMFLKENPDGSFMVKVVIDPPDYMADLGFAAFEVLLPPYVGAAVTMLGTMFSKQYAEDCLVTKDGDIV